MHFEISSHSVSFYNIASGARHTRAFSAKFRCNFGVFCRKNSNVRLNDGTLGENSNETFYVIFKHCVSLATIFLGSSSCLVRKRFN